MCPPSQSDSSFAEIMESKRLNRERLIRAIEQASPEVLEAAAQRLKEAMRKPDGERRRQRMAPPAFHKPAE